MLAIRIELWWMNYSDWINAKDDEWTALCCTVWRASTPLPHCHGTVLPPYHSFLCWVDTYLSFLPKGAWSLFLMFWGFLHGYVEIVLCRRIQVFIKQHKTILLTKMAYNWSKRKCGIYKTGKLVYTVITLFPYIHIQV